MAEDRLRVRIRLVCDAAAAAAAALSPLDFPSFCSPEDFSVLPSVFISSPSPCIGFDSTLGSSAFCLFETCGGIDAAPFIGLAAATTEVISLVAPLFSAFDQSPFFGIVDCNNNGCCASVAVTASATPPFISNDMVGALESPTLNDVFISSPSPSVGIDSTLGSSACCLSETCVGSGSAGC